MDKNAIKLKMYELNMRPEKLAVEANIGIATVYNILNGKKVAERTAFSVAKALGLPMPGQPPAA